MGNPDPKTDLSNPRLLQFAPRVPWPLDTGAKLRNYHLARVLSKNFQVTLLAFGVESSVPKQTYDRVVNVKRDEGYSIGKVLRGATGGTPLPLLNYTTEEMRQALSALLNYQEFDLIQVESVHLLDYLPTIRGLSKKSIAVCDWHNVESGLMRQYSDREESVTRRTYARRTARLMSEAEQRALAEFDAHIVVSEQDADSLRAMNSAARIFVIENGVDASYYAGASCESTTKNRIVFVGSMDYHANIDAAISFARNVWPAVHDKNPNLIFTIVGRDPSLAVQGLSSIAGVEVTGSVAEVRPYYREAIAAVVPLRVGGGSRLKILEAMAAGVPVVSTKLGAEGLKVTDGEDIVLASDDRGLAEKLEQITDDATLRSKLVANAHLLIEGRYDWSRLGESLARVYGELLSAAK